MPSGSGRTKGSVGRGDVFVVDEDTDLLDPIFQNGGQVNPQWKPPRNGLKRNQKGKPELSGKLLEENITTDKKADSGARTPPLFPGKPSNDIIDLDIASATKKPSVVFPALPKVTPGPRTSTDLSTLSETDTEDRSSSVSPTPHVFSSGLDKGSRRGKNQGKPPDKESPGTVTIVSRDRDLVWGSDGKMYRLKNGPPGRMGPPGPEVSDTTVLISSQSHSSH